jgi:hypothetical protein
MLRHTSVRAAGWSWANEGTVTGRKKCHACFIAEDAAATELTARVDGKHRDLLPAIRDQVFAESFDQAAFPGTGNTGYSNTDRISARRQALLHDPVGEFSVGGTRTFDQRDGFGECRAITLLDTFN